VEILLTVELALSVFAASSNQSKQINTQQFQPLRWQAKCCFREFGSQTTGKHPCITNRRSLHLVLTGPANPLLEELAQRAEEALHANLAVKVRTWIHLALLGEFALALA